MLLAACIAIGVPSARPFALWHALYQTNAGRYRLGDAMFPMGHPLSLAVEEHFYLLWPMLVMLAPGRWLVLGMTGMAVCGLLSRFALSRYDDDPMLWSNATPACVDYLAIGGLMALPAGGGMAWIRRAIFGLDLVSAIVAISGLGDSDLPAFLGRRGLAG